MKAIFVIALLLFTASPIAFANSIDADEIQRKREEMIAEQTRYFANNPYVFPGIVRCAQPYYQDLFRKASDESEFPIKDLVAIAVLESGCNPNAKSRSGALGIMQFMPRTGGDYGLVKFATRKKIETIRTRKGVRRETRHYRVIVKDLRRNAELSIFAAARHLKGLWDRLGSLDLAIKAYHAGEGLTNDFVSLARKTPEMSDGSITPAKMFFYNSVEKNKELFQKIEKYSTAAHDWSATYSFRVACAGRLFQRYVTGSLNGNGISCAKEKKEETPVAPLDYDPEQDQEEGALALSE